MVKELRKIILGEPEAITALDSYRHITNGFLPHGKIIACKLKADQPVTVTLEIISTTETKIANTDLKTADLLEPLIRFCIENNIMLPRNSKKCALVGDNQAVLFIRINMESA